MGAKFYDEGFLRAWTVYQRPDTKGSKAKAYSAWQKTASLRPSEDILLAAIQAYQEDLDSFNKGRSESFKRQMLHFSTFLSDRDLRWETYLDRAEQIVAEKKEALAPRMAAVSASRKSWPDDVIKRLGLAPAVFDAWFSQCTYIPGPPPVIIAPKPFIHNWIVSHFGQKMEQALPGVRVVSGQYREPAQDQT